MKIKKTSSKKPIIITLLCVALAIAGIAFYMLRVAPSPETSIESSQEEPRVNTVDLDPPTQEEIIAGEEKKAETVKDPQSQPPPSTINVAITAAQKNGELVQVRTLITTLVQGVCKLRLTKDSVVIERTADIQALASTSTCKGFDLPAAEVSPGSWGLEISVTAGDQTAKASQELQIE